ncbi:TetR/AcrR family transcriptional regulator [Aeromicrobium alkaliterrae]|uniref:TetR/AcrR family transcriptional regulator n=1 Tax=Aeromicrobium alkaliterrae TaxID=302168 RepID=A0ABN2K865_9ACTN
MVLKQAASTDADSKSARTRLRILDAAAEVLSERGYAGMRLSDVAEKADVQAPAIYYYFASRELLIEEVMFSGIHQMREHLNTALDGLPDGTEPLERLTIAIEEHLRHELELSNYATAAIRNAGQVPAAIRERYVAEQRGYGEIWARLLKSAHEAGDLREGADLYMAQMLIIGALNWTGEWWDPERGNIDTLVASAKTFILDGIT